MAKIEMPIFPSSSSIFGEMAKKKEVIIVFFLPRKNHLIFYSYCTLRVDVSEKVPVPCQIFEQFGPKHREISTTLPL